MTNVSILTPLTSDRKKFLQLMIMNIVGQDYDRDKMTWIILDTWKSDGTKTPPMLCSSEVKDIRCPVHRQIHEGASGFTLKHFKRMGGFSASGTGEGAKMFDGCGEKHFKKVDITKLMCCIAHDDNTCPKDRFLENKVECEIQGPQIKFLETLYPREDCVMVQSDSSDE